MGCAMIAHDKSIIVKKRSSTLVRDAYGVPTRSWVDIPVEGVGIGWEGGSTTEDRGPIVTNGITFYLPSSDVVISPADIIVFDGREYEPQGIQQQWQRPMTFSHLQTGSVVRARVVEDGTDRDQDLEK